MRRLIGLSFFIYSISSGALLFGKSETKPKTGVEIKPQTETNIELPPINIEAKPPMDTTEVELSEETEEMSLEENYSNRNDLLDQYFIEQDEAKADRIALEIAKRTEAPTEVVVESLNIGDGDSDHVALSDSQIILHTEKEEKEDYETRNGVLIEYFNERDEQWLREYDGVGEE